MRWVAVILICLGLVGCAADRAFRKGTDLLAEGKQQEALGKFEEARQLDPSTVKYRMAYLRTRDAVIGNLLEQADRQRTLVRYDEAERLYRQVLYIDGANDRALAGLRTLDNHRRWDEWHRQAVTTWEKKDATAARAKLQMILLENPGHTAAQKLLAQIDEQTAKPSPETALAAAYRRPITIEFKDTPLKTVFEVISRTSGLNFLFDKDVRTDQRTTIFLKNSTIEAAVNLLLLTNQLDQRVLDDTSVLIYPNSQAKQKEYQPLTVRSFYLANAEAKNVANTLKTILKVRDVVVDEKLNLLIVRDSLESVRLSEKLVALHDVPEPEVMLEVEILEVKRSRLLDLGVRWPDQITLSPLPSAAGRTLTINDLRNLNSASIGAGVGPITLNARKQDSDANILANPRIRARNREKAKILIGERVPNITTTSTSTGFVSDSVNYVDVGLKLEVEPTIFPDDEIAIKVSLEVSNIVSQVQTKSGSLAFQIGTRNATTVLRLRNGENQVLAGLINDEDRRTGNKVPGLGDTPIVGRLFGTQADDTVKTEIVLSITPRLVRNIRRPDAAIAEFDSGTETSLRSRIFETGASPANGASNGRPPTGVLPGQPAGAPPAASMAPPSPANALSPTPVPSGSVPSSAANAPVGAAQLRWEGPSQLKVGDTVVLQLLMQSGQPVVSIPLAIGVDPRVLQVVSVSEGDFLKYGGAATGFTSRVQANGQVLMTGTRTGEGGATASGSVATLSLRAVAPATEARIQLLTIAPVGLGGHTVNASLPAVHTLAISP